MAVLIITERDDIHGDALIWALGRLGVRCDRWSLSEFPELQRVSVRYSQASQAPTVRVDNLLPSEAYDAIWARRLANPKTLSPTLAAADVEMALNQARRYTEGIWPILSSRSVLINPLTTRRAANDKPYQLQAARDSGFTIPETLLSNDPAEVRHFYQEHRGDIICKFFTPAFWRKPDGGMIGLFTARVDEALLADEVSLTSCPAIFQKYVPKKADIRITFFGATYQAVRIWSQQRGAGSIDFRSDMRAEAPMEEMHLPMRFVDRLRDLSARLGLLHGSYDFVEQPDGSFTFLEVNEMGQFLWLEERVPSLPMLSTFAAFSLEPRADFQFSATRHFSTTFQEYLESEAYPIFRQELTAAGGRNSFQYQE